MLPEMDGPAAVRPARDRTEADFNRGIG
jgi:hypothetical protein